MITRWLMTLWRQILDAVKLYFQPVQHIAFEKKRTVTIHKGDGHISDFDSLVEDLSAKVDEFVKRHSSGECKVNFSIEFEGKTVHGGAASMPCPACGKLNRLSRGRIGAMCGVCKMPLSWGVN